MNNLFDFIYKEKNQQSNNQQQQTDQTNKTKSSNMLDRLNLRPKKAEQEDFDDFDSVTSSEVETLSNKSDSKMNKLTTIDPANHNNTKQHPVTTNSSSTKPILPTTNPPASHTTTTASTTNNTSLSSNESPKTNRSLTHGLDMNGKKENIEIVAKPETTKSPSSTPSLQPKISLNKTMSNSLSRLVHGRSSSGRKQTTQVPKINVTSEPDEELDQMDVKIIYQFFIYLARFL